MNLKSNGLKEKIALGVSKELITGGFIYKKAKNEFILSRLGLSFIFNILQTAWSNHFTLSLRLYISHTPVEAVYKNILGHSDGLTIGNTLERISKSPDGKQIVNGSMFITIYQELDIEPAIETLIHYYNEFAKPYYLRYQTLEALDDIINNPPFDYCPAHVGGGFADRCMKGLIVARLVKNLNYENLVQTYDEAIKETMNSESIENYYKVREYLMYNRIS